MHDLTQQSKALVSPEDSWGAEGADQSNVLIPRLSLMQDISDPVKKGLARAGDIVDTGTGLVVIPKGQTGEIIPILTYQEWMIFDVKADGKEKMRRGGNMLKTEANKDLPYEDVDKGQPIRRYPVICFFALFVPRIDELPFLLSFKKSNKWVGKQLTTHFKVSQMKHVPPAAQVFKLGAQDKTWEENTFQVNTLAPSRQTTPEELAIARRWYETLKQSEVKVADELSDADDSFTGN